MAMSVGVRKARYEAQGAYQLWLTHALRGKGFSASASHNGYIYENDQYHVLMNVNGAIVRTTKKGN